MSALKFGTSGLRGLVTDLTDDICASYTTAFLHQMHMAGWLKPGGNVLIGQDLRTSSPRIAQACMQAAAAFGAVVENSGTLPTPALALAAMGKKAPAIMVTGSHIPADRNGLKFYRPDGEIDKKDEVAINTGLKPAGNRPPRSFETNATAFAAYRTRCVALLAPDALQGMRVGIYQHSTVARDLFTQVITALGGKAIEFSRSDVFVPVDTEALRPEDVAIAAAVAREHALDAVISADGDADRPLVADEHGVFLRGDDLGLLTAQFLGADAVVTPVTSSTAAELSGSFTSVIRTRVGSPFVIEGMQQAISAGARAVLGYEANGGVLLGSDVMTGQGVLPALPTRDAMLPILAVLGMAAQSRREISDLKAGLPQRHTASGRLEHVGADRSGPFLDMLNDKAWAANFLNGAGIVRAVDRIDGTRFVLTSGDVIHYRASGNAPELRCYAESASAEKAKALMEWGLKAAESAL